MFSSVRRRRVFSSERSKGRVWPSGQPWSATTESGPRRGLRARAPAVCVFSDIAFLTDALCCPVAHRCSRARKPDERSGSTLEVIGVRHRQALMILGRLRGCVCSRGGRVCVHRPWGDGGRPRGARDEHRRTPGRCSCRCSCRDSSGQLGPITLSIQTRDFQSLVLMPKY